MNADLLEYQLLQTPTPEVRKLLHETVYGTKGGMQIRHLDTVWKLDVLMKPDFHVLMYNGEVVAVTVFCQRVSEFSEQKIKSYYIRYFSVSSKFQNLGLGNRLTELAVKHYKNTLSEPTLVYAYIESMNWRSSSVSKHFTPEIVGNFSPIFFSRFFPVFSKGVIEGEEAYKVLKASHGKTIRQITYSGRNSEKANFLSLTIGDRYAGVNYYRVKWEVINYPSSNFIMKGVLPLIPLVNRIVEGKQFNFIGAEDCFWNDEDVLIELLEHVLAKEGGHKLMMYADHRDVRFMQLRSHPKLGLMSKLQKPPKIAIQVFFHDVGVAMKDEVLTLPFHIKAFDVT